MYFYFIHPLLIILLNQLTDKSFKLTGHFSHNLHQFIPQQRLRLLLEYLLDIP